jgi:opacity protein-like surface antigen
MNCEIRLAVSVNRSEHNMKKAPLFAAAIALAASSAQAADLARPYVKAPPPAVAAIYDWSGFYIGAKGGYATSRNCWNFQSVAGAAFTAEEGCKTLTVEWSADRSAIGGRQAPGSSA